MKKILILSILIVTTLSCSKSEDTEDKKNIVPKELIGTWKFVGTYDDTSGSNFHPYTESNFFVSFNVNNSLVLNKDNSITNGSFNMMSNSVVTCVYDFNVAIPVGLSSVKIDVLTNSVLEVRNTSSTPDDLIIMRYEKVNTTP